MLFYEIGDLPDHARGLTAHAHKFPLHGLRQSRSFRTSQDPHVDRYFFTAHASWGFWYAFGPQVGISRLDLGQISLLVDLECFGRDGLSKACIHADMEGPDLGRTADRRCNGLFEDKF